MERSGPRARWNGVRTGLAALFALSLCAAARADTVLFREDFERGLGDRWVERGFPSIARRNRFSVAEGENGNRHLRVESDDSYSAKGVFLRFSPGHCSTVSWRWRIGGVLARADLRRREGDDAAARLYVVFDGPSFWNPFDKRALLYVWDNVLPVGTIVPNAWEPAKARMIVLQSGNERAGEWVEEKVDILDDFAKAFPGEDPLDVEGIAFLADTDNTHSEASADLDDLLIGCRGDDARGDAGASRGRAEEPMAFRTRPSDPSKRGSEG